MGGNGYVEENPFARFYREAPLNSIWEGSGNVMCLDVLRAFSKTPAVRAALITEIQAARGGNRRLDAFTAALVQDLGRTDIDESEARALTERIALALQGALLVQDAPATTADAFCASRLGGDAWGRNVRHVAEGCRCRAADHARAGQLRHVPMEPACSD